MERHLRALSLALRKSFDDNGLSEYTKLAATKLELWYTLAQAPLTLAAMYAIESHVLDYDISPGKVVMFFVCVDTMRHMLNDGHPHWGVRKMNTDSSYWTILCPPGFRLRLVLTKPQYLLLDKTLVLTEYMLWDRRLLQKGFCHKAEYERKIPIRATLNVTL